MAHLVDVRAFGELRILSGGRSLGPRDLGGRKPKQVLELLAGAGGSPVPKEVMVDLLWNDQPPRHPLAALENHVWVLRRHLADRLTRQPVVLGGSGAYRLAPSVLVDLARFDALVRRASHIDDGRRSLEEALRLVHGEVFEDEPYTDWALRLREAYGVKLASARLDVAELALADDDATTAVQQSQLVLDREPLSERACRVLVLGLAARGQRERAIEQLTAFNRRVRTELGVEPSPEMLLAGEVLHNGYGVASTLISVLDDRIETTEDDGMRGRWRRLRDGVEAIGGDGLATVLLEALERLTR
jgi:DNA-binding SARP family transcriptional activator